MHLKYLILKTLRRKKNDKKKIDYLFSNICSLCPLPHSKTPFPSNTLSYIIQFQLITEKKSERPQ